MPDRAPSRREALLSALSPAEKGATSEIAQALNAIHARTWPRDPETSVPPRPGIFQPDVPMVGDPHVMALLLRVLNQAPGTKARLKSITAGPTEQEIRALEASGLEPWDYPEVTNVLGQTTQMPGRKDVVSLNPGRSPEQQAATGMHELTHVAGALEEDRPRATKALWLKLLGLPNDDD